MHVLLLVFLTAMIPASKLAAQDADRDAEPLDARYYDFWPGTWHRMIEGEADTTSTMFRVVRGVNPAAFEETWRLVIDSATTLAARALRAWDGTAGRWMYMWISDEGHVQVWEGRKVGDHWYIYNEFDIQGDRYLSRQAWIPTQPGRLMRVSERSSDGGRTWQLRFREEYARTAN